MAADIYVRSTDGNNTDNGSTWALAKLDLVGAAAIDAAGDRIFVSDNHAESTAAAITITLAGTAASPVQIICVDDTGDPSPPTAVATTGTVTTTGNSNISVNGYCYVYGLTFNTATGVVNASLILGSAADNRQTYESCKFRMVASGSAAKIWAGTNAVLNQNASAIYWKNCDVRFAASTQYIALIQSSLTWEGGSVESGGTAPSVLFGNDGSNGRTADIRVSGVNLSNLSTTSNLVGVGSRRTRAVIRNCRLPASWAGSLVTGTLLQGDRVEMYNCDSGDTNYRIQVQDYAGSILDETTIVRTGGASDGTTTLSWKMVSTANAEYPHLTLDTPEIVRWNETTGSSITVTVETITDNVTLTDGECWLEVQYLGTSGFPLGTFISDAKADVLATAANQTTSSETWTTTGLTTPVKQKLSVSFTPQEKGYIHAVVKLAKASTTVYVCPKISVT